MPPECLMLFHALKSLNISECPNITTTPDHDFPCLENLSVISVKRGGVLLEKICNKNLGSLTSLKLGHISDVTRLPERLLYDNQCLLNLEEVTTVSVLFLDISRCPNLRSLPKGGISSLSHLTHLSIGPFSDQVDFASFCEIFQGIGQLQLLETLTLTGWQQFESLPDELQHLLSLSFFELCDFGIEALPEWFGNLSHLESLHLRGCKRLRHLPSKEAMKRLTKLQRLFVSECPLLREACNNPADNSERDKISHIPCIVV
ncbi:hypothetical protein Salat_1764100 [Sesamum alatum]|uniref:Uncharacterized protein n=1 Tax=Sesamum alatum TaxID=300844 RepID=A0AAE1Y9J9_9LAMI|nr:hypothetical protein Salat_1764100 [Sesamum alatum]